MATWQENVSSWARAIEGVVGASKASEKAMYAQIESVADEVIAAYGPAIKEVIDVASNAAPSREAGIGEYVGREIMYAVIRKLFVRESPAAPASDAAADAPASPDAPPAQTDAPVPVAVESIGMAEQKPQPGDPGFHV